MGRRDERPFEINEFHEVEAVILRSAIGIANGDGTGSALGLGEVRWLCFDGGVRVGDILDLLHDDFAALGKFFLELGHQSFGTLRVHGFERTLGVVAHPIGDKRD